MPRSAGLDNVSFPPATITCFLRQENQYTFERVALDAVPLSREYPEPCFDLHSAYYLFGRFYVEGGHFVGLATLVPLMAGIRIGLTSYVWQCSRDEKLKAIEVAG